MTTIARLLVERRDRSPELRIGLVGDDEPFADMFDRAAATATALAAAGLRAGDRVAVVGTNSRAYLQSWMALQLAGLEAALLNPTYPVPLLAEMVADLDLHAVAWIGPTPVPEVAVGAVHLDLAGAADGRLVLGGEVAQIATSPSGGDTSLPGLDRGPGDVAGYMHTSGTTGTPKHCRQTNEYFLRLARFIADTMGLGDADTVLAPLPLFHINPLGYGVVGGLLAGSSVLSADRFSASRFWDDVRTADVTALVLHGPPVEILKRATSPDDAAGHRVRIVFFADAGFLERFGIPLGVSAYGSTEAGGLSHTWLWRRGDPVEAPEGMSRYGGTARHDLEWHLDDDGQILVRSRRPHVLFDGYWHRGTLIDPLDADGWFPTGDLGRVDDAGNLVFIERAAESIRVKGEFVPIGYVEEQFAGMGGITDLAVWRRPSELVDDDVALFVAGDDIDLDAVRAARHRLPAFMQPACLVRVVEIPRDAGVGKVRRRQLGEVPVLDTVELDQ